MPSGVEHVTYKIGGQCTEMVKEPQMPSGVEHQSTFRAEIARVSRVKEPQMPSGVEHLVGATFEVARFDVKEPQMPSGVEHFGAYSRVLARTIAFYREHRQHYW